MSWVYRVFLLYRISVEFNTITVMQLQLPQPSPDAQAASHALQNLIADEIRQQEGWISFARFMELVLYAPRLGYYSGGAAKLGKEGDFTTAPEMTSLFGQTLARAVAELLAQTSPQIMEFGAGTGKLARDILNELAAMGVPVTRYAIVDLSGELRSRQRDLLKDFPQVEWLDSLPEAFCGVVIGNEVLDAMPVNLVVKTEEGWKERGVALAGQGFAYEDRACDAELSAQIPGAEDLPVGYLTEVHPQAMAFTKSLAAMFAAGYSAEGKGSAAVLIDYGFPAHEYYLPQRMKGTLMCHYRHHAHDDVFYLPGLQDVTSHVDFSAIARAAVEGDLEVLTYTSQAAFLLDAGMVEVLMRTSPDDQARYLPMTNAVQRLTSPAEMGELFKVLVLGRAVMLPAHFQRNDRSYRL
jgi:SAM-dependent MidA family methyltransferase